MGIEAGKTYHVGIDIADALKKSDSWLAGMLACTETGRDLTPDETRGYLQAEADKGYSMFVGCDNRNHTGGCAGHAKAVVKGMEATILARLKALERPLPSWFSPQSFTSEHIFDLLRSSKLQSTPGGRPAVHKALKRLVKLGYINLKRKPDLWAYSATGGGRK